MKRYAVFHWWRYYPSGGFDDFKDTFDDEAKAEAYLVGLVTEEILTAGQVVDLTNGKELCSYQHTGQGKVVKD